MLYDPADTEVIWKLPFAEVISSPAGFPEVGPVQLT